MAKFLNTSGTTYHLEELIKNASEKLILISPYLKLNDRIKELLEDKDRLKIDIRIVYGKNELQPKEISWLQNLTYVRTSFCKNLHAKCYLNESHCIITSLNLYEFSQVNNNEMGVYISKDDDFQLYSDTHDEAQRIIRISEEVRMAVEQVQTATEKPSAISKEKQEYSSLTTANLAKKMGLKTKELTDKLSDLGYVSVVGKEVSLTELGKQKGGSEKAGKYGKFIIWDKDLEI